MSKKNNGLAANIHRYNQLIAYIFLYFATSKICRASVIQTNRQKVHIS